jgi:hypothetical protein
VLDCQFCKISPYSPKPHDDDVHAYRFHHRH